MRETTCGHSPHFGKGLCRKCYMAADYVANGERRRAGQRAYAAANREREKRRAKDWREANPTWAAELSRAWHASNRDRHNIHENKRRALKRGSSADLTSSQWSGILQQFDHRCFYCGVAGVPLVQEHMTPLSRGGAHTASNVVPSCRPCNGRKYTKTAEEFLGLTAMEIA